MKLGQYKILAAKQRQIIAHLRTQLRVETRITNAFSKLVYHKEEQKPFQLKTLRKALAEKQNLNSRDLRKITTKPDTQQAT